jgi:hypothetical protein
VHSPYALYLLLRKRTTAALVECSRSTARCLALMLAVRIMRGVHVLPEASEPAPVPLVPEDDHHVAALTMPRIACGAATTAAP